MKRIYLLSLITLMIQLPVYSQLTGTKTIPGDYATMAAAITALNSQGVGGGGVTFEIAAGHKEYFNAVPTAGLITATGTSTDPIVFQKAGTGPNPRIVAGTGTSATTDGIIKLAGTDYITIEGLDLLDTVVNNTNTKRMEWGIAMVKKSSSAPFNGCNHVIIRNCTISLFAANTSARGIYSGNHIATATSSLTITATTDTHSDNKIYGNTINGACQAISLNGYAAPSPYSLYDQNNEIGVDGGNFISGFSSGNPSHGIFTSYQNNIRVANNTIREMAGNNNVHYGIDVGTAYAARADIYNNVVKIKAGTSAASSVIAIRCNTGSNVTGSVVRVNDNTIDSCGFNHTISTQLTGIDIGSAPDSAYIFGNTIQHSTVTGLGTFYGINYSSAISPGKSVIYSNLISENVQTGASGNMYCLQTRNGILSVYNNQIINNSRPSSSGTGNSFIAGYYNGHAPTQEDIYNNEISGLSVAGTGAYAQIIGLYSATYANKAIYGNQVHGLSVMAGAVTGISSLFGYTVHINNNRIYDLMSEAGTVSGTAVRGIENNGTSDSYIYNNYISDLKTVSASLDNSIVGIYQSNNNNTGQHTWVYYNTVYLDATSTGTDFGSSAFYCHSPLTNQYYLSVLLQNNIFVNNSTPNGTGFTCALKRNGVNLNTYSTASDNNDFYAGTPGPNHLIYFDGINTFETLDAFKNWVFPMESHSFTELPPFVNSMATPYDLHLQTSVSNLCESGGIPVTAPLAIISDYDGDARYPEAGYPDNPLHPAKAPDVGADEAAGERLDIEPPVISYELLSDTTYTGDRTLIATITDWYSGVPVSGIGLPVLYWTIFHNGSYGTQQSVQGVFLGSDQYSFTFGAGVVAGDRVYYVVLAQDQYSTPNVGISCFCFTTFTYNPPNMSPSVWGDDLYRVLTPMSGNYTVGVGQDFETVTAAFSSLADYYIAGDVTFLLTDEEYLSETYPISIEPIPNHDPDAMITLKPSSGVTPVLEGYGPYSGIFLVHGADNITFDGSNVPGGNDRSMTLLQTGSESVIEIQDDAINADPSLNCTIKNCNIQATTAYGNGIWLNGNSTGFSFVNNKIKSVGTGIRVSGPVEGVYPKGLISENEIGDVNLTETVTTNGIHVSYTDSVEITGNTILNIRNESYNAYGIALENWVYNSSITKNRITGIHHTGTGGYGGKGIYLNVGYASNTLIANNEIADISGDGWPGFGSDNICGISLDNYTANVFLFHNSVNLSGQVDGNTDNPGEGNLSAALYLSNNTDAITMINNIFRNAIEDTANALSLSYAVYSGGSTYGLGVVDYNDYFAAGPQGQFGYINGMDVLTLSSWQSSTSQDDFSLSEDPQFTSETNLLPNSSFLDGAGVLLPEVPDDINGVVRSDPPDIGAYEFTGSGSKAVSLRVYIEGLYDGSGLMHEAMDDSGPHFGPGIADQIALELHNGSNYADLVYTKTSINLLTDGTASFTIPGSFSGSYYLTVVHRNSLLTVSADPVSFAGSSISYDFTDSALKAFGGNMVMLFDGNYAFYGGDANLDGFTDTSDFSLVDNDAANFITGYLATDITGDSFVDTGDFTIIDNNNAAFVSAMTP